MTDSDPPFEGLAPILGKRLGALEAAWFTADAHERRELELVAALIRRRLSGGVPLLSPPSQADSDGPVKLGRILHGQSRLGAAGLFPHELTHHALIVGRTGAGKSNTALAIVLQLFDLGIPVLCLDHKRSLRSLLARSLSPPVHVLSLGRGLGAGLAFNPLCAPPGVPEPAHDRQLVELLGATYTAGDGVAALLLRTIEECRRASRLVPTLREVQEFLEQASLVHRERLWRQTALRILERLTTGPLGLLLNTRRDTAALGVLLHSRTILELDGLPADDSEFLVSHLLGHLSAELLAGKSREQLRLCVFLDEAHRLLARRDGAKESRAEHLLREGRELGLGLVLATQTFSGISQVALANCGTLIAMNCRHKADLQAAAQALLLREDQRDLLAQLPVGQAIVRLPARWTRSIHVEFPKLDLDKGRITDTHVLQAFLLSPYSRGALDRLAGSEDASADRAGPSGPGLSGAAERLRPPVPAVPPEDQGLTRTDHIPGLDSDPRLSQDPVQSHRPLAVAATRQADAMVLTRHPETAVLLRHIAAQPLWPVTQRYAALGLSRRKGDAAKRDLIAGGWVAPVPITTPTGAVLLLELSAPARAWLTKHKAAMPPIHGSLPHAYWQDQVARALRRCGWDVALEEPFHGRIVDVAARRHGMTVSAQIETGSSAWRLNMEGLAHSPADHKAVLWLDQGSYPQALRAAPQGVRLLQPRELAAWVRGLAPADPDVGT